MGILDEIVNRKKLRLAEAKAQVSLSELKSRINEAPEPRAFDRVLKREQGADIHVIAEIKKASPSKGLIREDFNPVEIARLYEQKGASAISVLTEEDFFQGSLEYIPIVKDVTSRPILRKDFIIDEYQIYEARAHQADAVLLIATILSREQADEYLSLAHEIGLQVLFEVHFYKELDGVLTIEAPIIGINNRNLDTLSTDLNTTVELLKDIPDEKIVVSESGISKREDVLFFEKTRVDALLIGTSLMKEDDIGRKYDELFPGSKNRA